MSPFGPVQRWETALAAVRDAGWPLQARGSLALGEVTLPWDAVARARSTPTGRSSATVLRCAGTQARASAASMPVATSRSTASGRIAAIRFWSPSPAPGSSAAGSRRAATARSASCAIGSQRDVLERSTDELARAGEFAEHVRRDRARNAVVAEVDDAPRDDAQVAGGEVHRLPDPLVPRELEALPTQERRDPRDREPESSESRHRSTERLQRSRLLEPALGAEPVAAAERLREGSDARCRMPANSARAVARLGAARIARDQRRHEQRRHSADDAVDEAQPRRCRPGSP